MGKTYSLAMYEKAVPSAISFNEKLKTAKIAGFDRVELSIDESDEKLSRLNWSSSKVRELRSLCDCEGVSITTICLSAHRKYPLGSHDKKKREKSLEIMEKAVDFGQTLGVEIIQLAGYDVYYEESDNETADPFTENLTRCVAMAENTGIMLGFETMETPFMDTVEKAMHYVGMLNSPLLGIYPDIGNLQNASELYGEDPIEDIKKGHGHILAMHLKETKPGIYRDMLFGSGGHTRYEDFINFAKAEGISNFTAEFWYCPGMDWKTETKKAVVFLREKLDKVYGN